MSLIPNIGGGYNITDNVFTAPLTGLYKFNLKMYAFGSRTVMGIASYPPITFKAVLWIEEQTTGVVSMLVHLKQGEKIVPAFVMEKKPSASLDVVDHIGPANNEFSGELVDERA